MHFLGCNLQYYIAVLLSLISVHFCYDFPLNKLRIIATIGCPPIKHNMKLIFLVLIYQCIEDILMTIIDIFGTYP